MSGQKRGFDGAGSGGNKRSRGDPNSVTLRFMVNSKNAGGIIGKGGATIKRLRNDYEAHVTVPDSTASVRVLSIQASKEKAVGVLLECLPLYGDPPQSGQSSRSGEKTEFEINFLMHSSQVGGVIGKGGDKIKELRANTNASVKVFQECVGDSNERIIAVGGGVDEITNCLNALLDVMVETPIKGPVNLFDPSTSGYDDFSYGGMSGGGGRGGRGGNSAPRGGGRGGMGGGRGGGMGGGMGGPPIGGGGGYNGYGGDYAGNQWGSGGGDYYSGNNYAGGMGGGNFGGGPGSLMNAGGERTTTQVTIPKDKAGAIIGRGGERIRNIRMKSNCEIKIEDGASGNDRLISITGAQSEIQHAQYLMQTCVREFGDGSGF